MRKLKLNHILGLRMMAKPIEIVCAEILRRELPMFSHEYIDAAVCGDPDAAGMLTITDNNKRPLVLFCLFASCRNSAGFRVALSEIWDHDGSDVVQVIDTNLLRGMFACGGQPPTDLPSLVTVYRGGYGTVARLRKGWSWTTERGVAAWFALRSSRTPLVVEANVRASRILHSSDQRGEKEIVLAGGSRRAVISGTQDDWNEEAAAWRAGSHTIAMAQEASPVMPLHAIHTESI